MDYLSNIKRWVSDTTRLDGYFETVSYLERSRDPKEYITGLILDRIANETFDIYWLYEDKEVAFRNVLKGLLEFNRDDIDEYWIKKIERFNDSEHLKPDYVRKDDMDKVYESIKESGMLKENKTILFIDHPQKDSNNLMFFGNIISEYPDKTFLIEEYSKCFTVPSFFIREPDPMSLRKQTAIYNKINDDDSFIESYYITGNLVESFDIIEIINKNVNIRRNVKYKDRVPVVPVARALRESVKRSPIDFVYGTLLSHMIINSDEKTVERIISDDIDADTGMLDVKAELNRDLYSSIKNYMEEHTNLGRMEYLEIDNTIFGYKSRFIFGEEISDFSVSFDESLFNSSKKIADKLRDKLKEIEVGAPVLVKRRRGDVGITLMGYMIAEMTGADKIYFYNPRKINRIPKDLPTDVTLFYDNTVTGSGLREALQDMEDRNVNAISIIDMGRASILNHLSLYNLKDL